MRLTSLIASVLLLGVQVAQAENLCTISKLDHPSLEERSRVLQFPSGQRYILIGHDHGDPDERGRLSRWLVRPVAGKLMMDEGAMGEELPMEDNPIAGALLTEDWIARLDEFLARNAKAQQHVKEDLAFLRSTYWTTETPILVALEAYNDAIEGKIGTAEKIEASLMREACDRKLGETPQLRDVELLLAGAAIYSYRHDPELRDKYRLMGVDGDEEGMTLQKLGTKTMRIADARLTKLTRGRKLDEETIRKQMQRVIDEMNAAYADTGEIFVYDHEIIRQRLDRYLEGDQELRGAVLSYLFGYLDFLRGMKKRDVAMVSNLLEPGQSAVLLVGEEHLDSLVSLLTIPCEQALPKQTPVAEEPTPGLLDEILERY